MKEIGEELKKARESMNISVEEVSEDLKTRASQIENLEAGNRDAFDDIFYLKYLIRDYAKYLGLNKEELVDDFNEYLFDLTSRLSLEDIKMAKKKIKETKTVKSPYTKEKKSRPVLIPLLVYIVIVILVVSIIYFITGINDNEGDFKEGTTVTENK